jgi:hypothetical protein
VFHQDYLDCFVWKCAPRGPTLLARLAVLFFMVRRRSWGQRSGLQDSVACALCSPGTETIDHLLLGCVFAREVCYKVLMHCGWQHLASVVDEHLVLWWLRSRKFVVKARRKAFDSFVVLIVWSIWLERNAMVFRSVSSSTATLVEFIWTHCKLWCRTILVDWSLLLEMQYL